jgi:nucleoside-diphosphate-sugar epimerase
MLILIAGVSGNLGRLLAQHSLDRGHQVRGFGRSPSKLPASLLERFESFVECDFYDNRVALDKAVSGADAVICSYVSHAEAILESQLALLRAVERAGIKIYHGHSWNSDWTKVGFEDWEHYDAYKSFRRHVELTSAIRPVYVFTGIVAEFAFSEVVGIAHLKQEDGETVMAHWGSGDAKWDFTYFDDAARFSVDLITTNEPVLRGEGGFFRIHSAEASAKDLARAYEKVHGDKIKLKSLGDLGFLKSQYELAKTTTDPRKYFSYGNYYIQAVNIEGTWKLENPTVVGGVDAVERLFQAQIDIPREYQ